MKRPRLLAHRCGQVRGVENTLSAMRRAREDGADGVECDVRLTADGEPVLFHDDDLLRACGVRRPVRALRWAQLRSLRVFGAERVPHLEEALRLLEDWPEGELTVDLHEDRFDLAERAARCVADSPAAPRCSLLAFYSDRSLLLRAREVRPSVRVSVMPGAPWNVAASVSLRPVELCLGWDRPLHRLAYSAACRLYPARAAIAGARAAGVPVSGGIAASPEDVRYFLAQGVDGLWADDVAMARAALESPR